MFGVDSLYTQQTRRPPPGNMETQPLNPPELHTTRLARLRPALSKGPVTLLIWGMLMCLAMFIDSLGELRPQQQARQDDTGVDPIGANLGASPRRPPHSPVI